MSETEGDGGVSRVEREEAGGACCARGEVAKLGAIQRVERIEGQFRVKRSVVVRFSGHGEGGWRFKYKGFYVCVVPRTQSHQSCGQGSPPPPDTPCDDMQKASPREAN